MTSRDAAPDHEMVRSPGELRLAGTAALLVPVVLLLLHATLAWLGREPGVMTGHDDARYIGAAHSLLSGSYRDTMWPGSPWHHQYPPGYPALLALAMLVGGDRYDVLVIPGLICSVAALAFIYDALRRVWPGWVAVASLAILAVNPWLLSFAGMVASEASLTLCIAVAVWGSVALPAGRRQEAVMLAAVTAAPLMRAVGVVLPAALVLYWLTERRWRAALLAAASLLFVAAPTVWWLLSDPDGARSGTYATDLAATLHAHQSRWLRVLRHAARGVQFYSVQALPWLVRLPSVPGTPIDNAVWLVLLVAGLAAGAVDAVRRWRVVPIVMLAFVSFLVLWAWHIERFLVPLLPLIVPLWLAGLARVGRVMGARAATASVLLVAGIVVLTNTRAEAQRLSEMSACVRGTEFPDPRCTTAEQRSFFTVLREAQRLLPDSTRILAAKSVTVSHYTHRLTVPLDRYVGLADSALLDTVRAKRADALLLSRLIWTDSLYLVPVLERHCASLSLVTQSAPHTYLFRIDPSGHSADSARACAAVSEWKQHQTFSAPVSSPSSSSSAGNP